MSFPFGQPDSEENKPSRDCGYRCLYYAVKPNCSYKEFLHNFRFFQPVKSGITFTDICIVLNYFKKEFCFTQLKENGLYIVYSGIWLHHEGKKHGHYFIYENGFVLCSTHTEPYPLSLNEVEKRLEAKDIDHAFRCLKIINWWKALTSIEVQQNSLCCSLVKLQHGNLRHTTKAEEFIISVEPDKNEWQYYKIVQSEVKNWNKSLSTG